MRIGELRHKICIEEKVTRRSSSGSEEVTWSPFLYSGASIEPLTGREFYAARQTQAAISHKITMRYQTGIRPSHRITWAERVFNIEAILNKGERNRELTILATEVL